MDAGREVGFMKKEKGSSIPLLSSIFLSGFYPHNPISRFQNKEYNTLMAKYKLVIFVPQTHLEQVRIAVCNAGAGKIGNYDNCTFLSSGIGTFRPLESAKPAIGKVGELERVGEARLETIVEEKDLKSVITEMKKVHPYEEIAYDVYKLEELKELNGKEGVEGWRRRVRRDRGREGKGG